jgi:DNA processing protein
MTTSATDLPFWLTVARASYLHAGHLRPALAQAGGPAALWRQPAPLLQSLGLPPAASALLAHPPEDWEQDLRWLEREAVHLLPCADPQYPARLAAIAAAPAVLFVRGQVAALGRPQIGVVGTRQPSPAGRELARELADQLTRSGLLVTSGLARGIDAAAHRGALEAGGETVAVLGCGLDHCYPPEHEGLALEVAARGACISEFAPGETPQPRHFPRRNRIISGLSLGIVVVEAASVSGSLITARLALEQGREVFAVPGSLRNPQAAGCHELIRDGARLVRSGQDIIDELGSTLREFRNFCPHLEAAVSPGAMPDGLDSAAEMLLDACGFEPVSRDVMALRTGLEPRQVATIVLKLELQQRLEALPGGLYGRLR